MNVLSNRFVHRIKQQGRHASATLARSGRRCSGFLIGNQFVYSDQSEVLWMSAGPGEFRELKIWRK